MKSGNLVTKFNFLFFLVFFLLTLSVNSEEVQISPLLKLDEISPSYEEVFDEDLNIRPEVSVYLNIYDKKNNDKLFAGWMLKTLPSVSSLEHPLYDIWINDCA